MSNLNLAPNLQIEAIRAATETWGFIGRRGGGKSYAASKFVEELHSASVQFCVVDPVGVWWGLRLDKDGKTKGLDIPIIGGQRGDIPLEPNAGALIAQIVSEGHSLVLDVSEMTKGEQILFVGGNQQIEGFAPALIRLKKQNRSALMTVWEEAQEFVPQHVSTREAMMVGAMERLVKLGRNFGIGATLITQRPQAVNKDALNMTEALVVFQTSGFQEREALRKWIIEQDRDSQSLVDTLPSLEQGDGWLWSPQWLRRLERVRFNPKRTYDASSTPGRTPPSVKPGKIDLEALREAMKETIKRSEAEDPTRLREEVKRLGRQLNEARNVRDKCLDHSWHPGGKDHRKLTMALDALRGENDGLRQTLVEILASAKIGADDIERISEDFAQAGRMLKRICEIQIPKGPAIKPELSEPFRIRATPPEAVAAIANGNRPKIPPGEAKILAALIQHSGKQVSKDSLTVLTGYKRSSRDEYLRRLHSKGWISLDGNSSHVTPAGRIAMPEVEPLPTGEALQAWHLHRLPAGESAILLFLIKGYPDWCERDAIGVGTEYKRSSRDEYLRRLAARMLVQRDGTRVRASADLF